jgi:hypothetical protein
VPADGTNAANWRNGDFGTSPFCRQRFGKQALAHVPIVWRLERKINSRVNHEVMWQGWVPLLWQLLRQPQRGAARRNEVSASPYHTSDTPAPAG